MPDQPTAADRDVPYLIGKLEGQIGGFLAAITHLSDRADRNEARVGEAERRLDEHHGRIKSLEETRREETDQRKERAGRVLSRKEALVLILCSGGVSGLVALAVAVVQGALKLPH